jgi:hypothetical protein
MKEYLSLAPGSDATHIKLEVYYTLGGHNCFTGREEARGYYLSVVPVKRWEQSPGVTLEQFVAFTGTKMLVKPCNRKSAKAELEAERNAQTNRVFLIDYVCKKGGLKLEEAAP